jgi:hypothetical protein
MELLKIHNKAEDDVKKDLNKFLIDYNFNLKTWVFKKKIESKNVI